MRVNKLVLYQVGRRDLDVGVHDPGWLRADLQPMPGMRHPAVKGVRKSQADDDDQSPICAACLVCLVSYQIILPG
jgi:hypothetical protein